MTPPSSFLWWPCHLWRLLIGRCLKLLWVWICGCFFLIELRLWHWGQNYLQQDSLPFVVQHKTVFVVSAQFTSKADLDQLELPPTMISQLAKVISPLYFKTPTANYFLLLMTGSGNRSWRAEPGDPIIFVRFPFNSLKLQQSSHFLKGHPVTSWQDKDLDLRSRDCNCECCWPFWAVPRPWSPQNPCLFDSKSYLDCMASQPIPSQNFPSDQEGSHREGHRQELLGLEITWPTVVLPKWNYFRNAPQNTQRATTKNLLEIFNRKRRFVY